MTTPQTPQAPPPYPGVYMSPQPPPRKRHPVLKWLLRFTIGLVALFLLIRGIGSLVSAPGPATKASHPPVTAPAAPAAAPADTSTPAPSGPDMLTVGATETLANNSTNATEGTVTVDSVHVTTQPADPSFGSPPANGYYVIVHITAAADPAYTSGFDINALDFYALAPGGRQFSQMNGNATEALSSAQESTDITAALGAGQSSSGWEAFDVSRPHGEIVYAPNLDGQPLAEWRY